MAPETKEKESKAVTAHKPVEILPRAHDMTRWFDRMVDEFWRRPLPTLMRPERWWPAEADMIMRMPAVDVYEEKDHVVIKAEIPGLAKEDISVQLTYSTLTIKGEKKREEEVKEDDYYRCERSFGLFTMKILLISSGVFHPPLAAHWRLWRILRQELELYIDYASSLEALPRRELARYAALVPYFHHKHLSPAALVAFTAYVSSGGGVLALHSVTASFKETIPFFEIIGGRFTGHGAIEPIHIQPVPGSWLLEGLPPFTVRDELYLHEMQPGLTAHAIAQEDRAGQQGQVVPLVWTHHYGKGRICYACPGHLAASLANPSYQEVLRRGSL